MEQLPSVQQKHTALGMGSEKRALERRGTEERTVPGMAGIGQQGSLASSEEDWGKEEENACKGGMETQGECFQMKRPQPARSWKPASPQCGQQMFASSQ